ncbi:Zinc finger, PMZ-type [Sesbania bispinosa]|nr:Zinc finger, PMZ-type [Sesbania bispinosa]
MDENFYFSDTDVDENYIPSEGEVDEEGNKNIDGEQYEGLSDEEEDLGLSDVDLEDLGAINDTNSEGELFDLNENIEGKRFHSDDNGKKVLPKIAKDLSVINIESRACIVYGAGRDQYEVNDGNNRDVVDLQGKTCGCTQWKISGLPCIHTAATANRYKRAKIEDYVDGSTITSSQRMSQTNMSAQQKLKLKMMEKKNKKNELQQNQQGSQQSVQKNSQEANQPRS